MVGGSKPPTPFDLNEEYVDDGDGGYEVSNEHNYDVVCNLESNQVCKCQFIRFRN